MRSEALTGGGLWWIRCEPSPCTSACRTARCSPLAESTACGRWKAIRVPITNTRKAPRSGQPGPIRCSSPPTAAATPVASSPARVTREFAFTRDNRLGSSRGTTTLRTTPYALDATSTPSASG